MKIRSQAEVNKNEMMPQQKTQQMPQQITKGSLPQDKVTIHTKESKILKMKIFEQYNSYASQVKIKKSSSNIANTTQPVKDSSGIRALFDACQGIIPQPNTANFCPTRGPEDMEKDKCYLYQAQVNGPSTVFKINRHI